jgi:SAM-dependent methyltransferase
MSADADFDLYSEDYDAALAQGISISGEDKNFFAEGRVTWLSGCVKQLQQTPKSVLDFGCGTGSATPYLLDLLKADSVKGVDVSARSLETARQLWHARSAEFISMDSYVPDEQIDLAFCNGVFHHIARPARPAALDFVYRSLKPGGLFALWENNPWNPGTRYVMRRCPFDRDAITLSPPETRKLLRAAGFKIISTDFLFIFPKALKWFRPLEPLVSRLPVGTQYQVLCRKPLTI